MSSSSSDFDDDYVDAGSCAPSSSAEAAHIAAETYNGKPLKPLPEDPDARRLFLCLPMFARIEPETPAEFVVETMAKFMVSLLDIWPDNEKLRTGWERFKEVFCMEGMAQMAIEEWHKAVEAHPQEFEDQDFDAILQADDIEYLDRLDVRNLYQQALVIDAEDAAEMGDEWDEECSIAFTMKWYIRKIHHYYTVDQMAPGGALSALLSKQIGSLLDGTHDILDGRDAEDLEFEDFFKMGLGALQGTDDETRSELFGSMGGLLEMLKEKGLSSEQIKEMMKAHSDLDEDVVDSLDLEEFDFDSLMNLAGGNDAMEALQRHDL